jgi:PHD/YefM family antitoxin component YafN of YafNO toxin-antitoxin module
MKTATIKEAKDQLPALMKAAGPVLVTRHGKPAGVIIGFPTEADYLDWKIENDPRFRTMMEKSLAQKAAGKSVPAAKAREMLLGEKKEAIRVRGGRKPTRRAAK